MFNADDPKDWKYDLKVATLTAGLTALATGLVEWGLNELKSRISPTPPKPEEPKKESETP